ncbi:MAG: hypothetical protein J6C10_05560, partial [Prevotella sp.]|nr:hypothetical protein [Prevotella sp.]
IQDSKSAIRARQSPIYGNKTSISNNSLNHLKKHTDYGIKISTGTEKQSFVFIYDGLSPVCKCFGLLTGDILCK